MSDKEYINKLEAKIKELVAKGCELDTLLQVMEESVEDGSLQYTERDDWAVVAGEAYKLIGYWPEIKPFSDATEFKGILDNVTDFHG